MTSTARRYSLANPPPTQGDLDGRETTNEAQILEVQALQAERDGDGHRSVQLLERALQIRCHVVNQLREKWANAPDAAAVAVPPSAASHRMSTMSLTPMTKDDVLREYQAQCSDLYDAAERLVVSSNACGVEHFKKDAFDAATPLFEYAMQLTEEGAYPLGEVEERRRHLRGVTLNNLGCMERRRGHLSEALNYMKASMEMTGVESPVAYMNMSAILIQLRLNDEAVRMAERSIALLAQAPEEPSLLAVAHHNLAMALEPVDQQRCMAEYELAHHVACATLGQDSATSQSIKQSWQRFQRSRGQVPVPPSNSGRFATSRGGANPRQHHAVAVGSNSGRTTSPVRPTSPHNSHGRTATTTPLPADTAEIFPHPFLVTASAPRRPQEPSQRGKAAAYGGRPAAPRFAQGASSPERGAAAQHRPAPPAAARVSPSSGVRAGRGREPAVHTPTPPSAPSQKSSVASRRFSPSRAADGPSGRPPAVQRRLSEHGGSSNNTINNNNGSGVSGGSRAARNGSRLSPLQAVSAAGAQAKTSQSPRRPTEKGASRGGLASSSSSAAAAVTAAPPRVLPPLHTGASEAEAAAASASTTAPRPSRDTVARASTSQRRSSAAAPTMEENPLAFMQSRLEVLLQDEEELEQKYVHARTIQRHYRGHLARKQVAKLRSLRARDARLAELRRSLAARQIQHAYRNHRRQRRYPFASHQLTRYPGGRRSAQHSAATKLQRVARGWLARRQYAKMRQYAQESPVAASRIQRWYRSLRARRHHASLLAQKAVQEAAMEEQEQRLYAASRIQRQWRAYSSRRAGEADLRNRRMARAAELAERRVAAAVRIQAAWRGSEARRVYRNAFSRSWQLRAARQEYERRRQAAVKLQAFGRMIIARRETLPELTAARLRAARDINARGRQGRAATTIQCAYRSYAARRAYAARKAARDAAMRGRAAAALAVVLQRAGRGYVVRKAIGEELAAMQGEAERYERQLRELERLDAAAAHLTPEEAQQRASALQTAEGDTRSALASSEREERRVLLHHCDVAAHNVAAEVTEREARQRAALPALDEFARVIKAKQERARRQNVRDAYLEQRSAAEEAAHEDASARVVTAFMRTAGARNSVLARASIIADYNEVRVEQEAASAAAAEAPEERELSTSQPARPYTAQQIAQERKRLDSLTAAMDAEADTAADVPAAGAEDASPAKGVKEASLSDTEAALLAEQRAVWQAGEAADRQRRLEQEALHRAMFAYKQERIAAAEAERDLVPYTRERVRLQRLSKSGAEATQQGTVTATEPGPNVYRQQRTTQQRSAVATIERRYLVYRARKHFAALQRVRDDYLDAQQDYEKDEGPVLMSERLSDIKARHPTMEMYQRRHVRFSAPAVSSTESSAPAPASPPVTASPAQDVLDGFARVIKAKQERARRQNVRDAYLEQRGAAEEAAHEDASARVVTAFMRTAGARQFLLARASIMADYNEARIDQEEASGEEPRPRSAAEPPQGERKVRFRELTPAQLEKDAAYESSESDASSTTPAMAAEHRRPTSAEARERLRGFVQGVQDKKELRRRQARRDAYLRTQEVERPDAARKGAGEQCHRSSPFDDVDGIRAIYQRERLSYAEGILDGFARVVKARQERVRRQGVRDAYLEQRGAAEEAAHEDASARVVTAFMRTAGARNSVLARASIIADYNEVRVGQEAASGEGCATHRSSSSSGSGGSVSPATAAFPREGASEHRAVDSTTTKAAAALTIQRCFRGALARQELSDRQEACRSYLEEQMAVEELLHTAALAIQCVYRGHRARQLAAMATVRRDLYLLSLHAQTEVEEGEDSAPAAVDRLAFIEDGEEEVAAAPLYESSDREMASTAVVMPVDDSAEL